MTVLYVASGDHVTPQRRQVLQERWAPLLERYQIEGRGADEIASDLTRAFDAHCTTAAV